MTNPNEHSDAWAKSLERLAIGFSLGILFFDFCLFCSKFIHA